jgi:hypothetical protein
MIPDARGPGLFNQDNKLSPRTRTSRGQIRTVIPRRWYNDSRDRSNSLHWRKIMAAVTPEQLEVLSDLTESDGLYEVVDGRIVEKSMGAYENWLAALLY